MEFVFNTPDKSLTGWIDAIFDSYYGELAIKPPIKHSFEVLENNERVGAITFKIFSNWIKIQDIAVVKSKKGNGVGSALLQKAEEFAKSNGCIGSMLTTISYQSPEFYKNQGYEVFAEVEPYSNTHKKIFFKKVFKGE